MAFKQNILDYLLANNLSYLGIFIVSALGGYLIPLPEEVIILIVGYITAYFGNNPYIAALAAILGISAGDNVIFWLSYRGLAGRFGTIIRKNRLLKYKKMMKNNVGKTIFILKFFVGLRFFAPFLAGSMKVKWMAFQIYSLFATIIYVPILFLIGYHSHNQLARIIVEIEILRHFVFVLIIFAITYLGGVYLKNNIFRPKAQK